MARARLSMLKSLSSSSNPYSHSHSFKLYTSYAKLTRRTDQGFVRASHANFNCHFHQREQQSAAKFSSPHLGVRPGFSGADAQFHKPSPVMSSPRRLNLHFQRTMPLVPTSLGFRHHLCSMYFSSKAGNSGDSKIQAVPDATGTDVSSSDVIVNDWIDKIKDVWHKAADAVTYSGQKAKEASDEVYPHVQQLLDSHPYLKDVVIPLSGTLLVWVVMPRIFRRFHNYATQAPATLLPVSSVGHQVPYDKSFWGALEDPVRYLVTFIAFSQIAMMVAPTTIASQYLPQAWRGAVILSFVWFLYRWKTNVFARALTAQSLAGIDRDRLLTLDKVSSFGLFFIGIMALAEACGVAVQSILTVGGIGGVATAFAARDILGNVLSGMSMQFSKPFSVGDTIKAGSVEGQVVEMGLTTTMLLSSEKFPVLVPNSLFSNQVIVNKSRAERRAVVSKIPMQIDDLDKIPQISNDIMSMLKSNPKVSLEKEAPYCFLSHIESSYAELTFGCNLRHMRREDLYSAQQDILLQSVQIIKKHGATLGSTFQDMTSR